MKLHLPRRRIWRAAIYLGSFLLVLIAIDVVLVQVWRRIGPGFATTRIIEPLKPDGSVDYLIAIESAFSQGVTPENNAAPMMLQALGRQALASNQPPNGITDRLGMPPLPEKGDYFIQYEEYRRQHSATGEDPEYIDISKPLAWPVKVDDVTARWIRDNEKPLALIAEATGRPRFFIPFYGGHRTETLPETLLPYLHPMRDAARALRLRALMRLQEGDVAGFRDDLLTMHRLARLVGQQPTMIDQLVAMAIENAACQATRVAAANSKLPAADARAMAAELAAMGDVPSFTQAINITERFMVLDTLQVMARAGPRRAGQLINLIAPQRRMSPPIVFYFLPLRYERSMREMNRFYDGALAALHEPTYTRRVAMLRLWQEQIPADSLLSPVRLLSGGWPVKVFAPNILSAQQREQTCRMQGRLTQVTLALAAYHAEHSAYPATLAELAPDYLPAVPDDAFSGKPLIYSRRDGGYILYSVGPNGTDDGGQSTKPSDDLIASVP